MKLSRALAIRAGVGGLVLCTALWGYSNYRAKRAETDRLIKLYEDEVAWKDQDAAALPRINSAMRELTATTLGADEETVNAELRTALNEMASSLRLAEVSVATSAAAPHPNPAAKGKLTVFSKQVRDRADFSSVAATVSAKGSLDQAIQLVALIEAQPWAHRVDGFLLRPLGKERERFDISITLSTMFMTDSRIAGPAISGRKSWASLKPAQWAPWEPVAQRNVFRAPPPPPTPAVASDQPPPKPTPPAAPSLSDWKLTGVVRGRAGPQMLVRNEKSQQDLVLSVGEKVLDAEFVDGSGETARIRIGADLFEVRLGSPLSERKPTIQ